MLFRSDTLQCCDVAVSLQIISTTDRQKQCHAGIAGGADIVLIPEIPYDIDQLIGAIRKRTEEGKKFSILAVLHKLTSLRSDSGCRSWDRDMRSSLAVLLLS